jgi:hypothetical protein
VGEYYWLLPLSAKNFAADFHDIMPICRGSRAL